MLSISDIKDWTQIIKDWVQIGFFFLTYCIAIIKDWTPFIKDWTQIIKDCFQIGFFVLTACVAIKGLNKWQEELKGKIEYEAAKQALVQAYLIHDQIRIVRGEGIISVPSLPILKAREPKKYETNNQRIAEDRRSLLRQKFQVLEDKLPDIYPVMVEVKAVFGEEAMEKLKRLTDLTSKLNVAIEAYCDGVYEGKTRKEIDKYYNIIFNINEVECPDYVSENISVDDMNFRKNLDAAMEEIKDYFIPKLDRELSISWFCNCKKKIKL
ncbi:MAG: hypothetical protein DCF12_09050 [Snowella sp.]|nr:MAG: hypothetical protein DCF12_09050 [Snowella sp.]